MYNKRETLKTMTIGKYVCIKCKYHRRKHEIHNSRKAVKLHKMVVDQNTIKCMYNIQCTLHQASIENKTIF